MNAIRLVRMVATFGHQMRNFQALARHRACSVVATFGNQNVHQTISLYCAVVHQLRRDYPNSLPLGRAKWKADPRYSSILVAKCGFYLDKRGSMQTIIKNLIRTYANSHDISIACHPPCADGRDIWPPDA